MQQSKIIKIIDGMIHRLGGLDNMIINVTVVKYLKIMLNLPYLLYVT